jgi:SAM-dependent methyltransferase
MKTLTPDFNKYVKQHTTPYATEQRIATHRRYARYLTPQSKVLDWGCANATDAKLCMERGCRTEACDVLSNELVPPGINYTRLIHCWHLPYPTEEFDVVISHGTLEHVPFESNSLEEIWRVLRVGGHLVIACLPQRYSIVDGLNRILHRPYHKRRYTRYSTHTLLLSHGFLPVETRCHWSAPMALGEAAYLWPSWIEHVPGLRALTQNLFVVARKVMAIGAEV